jgi:thioredoxin reductase
LSAPGKEIMDDFAEHAQVSGSEFLQEMVSDVHKTDT